MKKIYPFFRLVPVFFLAGWALSPVINYVWSVNKLLWWILALPMLYMFVYTMQVLDLIFLLLRMEKWVIVAELKRMKVFGVGFFGKKITVVRVFYVCLAPDKERIASVLAYGTRFEKSGYLYAYRQTFKNTKAIFDPLAILLLFMKIMLCGIVILAAVPLLDGLTTRLLKLLPV